VRWNHPADNPTNSSGLVMGECRPCYAEMIETTGHSLVLAERLRERIRHAGPLTFRDWMKAALYDPFNGYYCQSDRTKWGREGDYRTSPERSSLFAATFAGYFAGLYEDLGRPSQWTIVEAGAGEGHFASGVLQTLQTSFPTIFAATTYVFDEISSHSRAIAQQRLEPFGDRAQFKRLVDVKIDPGVVFSNELLDAFPVHRVTMQDGQLREFYVNVGQNRNFEWLLDAPSKPRLDEYFEELGIQLGEGQVAEVSLEVEEWLRTVAAQMGEGYLVTVDYGATAEQLYSAKAGKQGTLRGFQRHHFVDDLLARPGAQDLTTTVNWSLVKSVGALLGFAVVEFERQDRFLLAAGLLEHLESEARQCEDDSERLLLSTAAREMILPDGMASHFQVLVQKKTS
jgi:SAM-dependent MidA family methyltransferase